MSLKVTILGSNSALPTSQRFSSAQVLQMLERYFLIDCAEGTQMQLRKVKLCFSRINNVFISHLHGDHFYGILGLFSSFNLLGRKTALNVYAPKEFQKVIDFYCSIEKDLNFKINFFPLSENKFVKIFEDRKVEIFAFPLKHRVSTFGYLFREKPKERSMRKDKIVEYNLSIAEIKSIKEGSNLYLEDGRVIMNDELTLPPVPPLSYAYCSDTLFDESLIPILKDVDVLYHESTFTKDMAERAKETCHSTAEQAATIASKANVKQLIIGHFSARYTDLLPFLEEAKVVFENTYLAKDCKVFVYPEISKK